MCVFSCIRFIYDGCLYGIMAIVKLSSSKKAVQFVLSEDVPAGTVFQVSASLYENMLKDRVRGGFVVLSRLANPVPPGKFPESPVWGERVDGVKDGLGVKAKKVYEQVETKKKSEGYSPW